MHARRPWGLLVLPVAVMPLLLSARPCLAQQSFTETVGNVDVRITIPEGVTRVKGVLTFTARGLAGGWAKGAPFAALAKRLDAGIAVVSRGDDLNDDSYPKRCKSGEFDNIPKAFVALAAASKHPELAHAPLVGIGHSHGGDYWNWFTACHPERMAMVFVHASGGVTYTAAALQVPVLYELGMNDLVENGSGKPRAGMFANRSRGGIMSLVLGAGEGHNNVSAASLDMVIALIEPIFKLRVPADADASKGPVVLNVIDETSGQYWLGDLYAKEAAPYGSYAGMKALTTFLPNAEIAARWKMTGPALPKSIELPTNCNWCGTPTDEPKATPGDPVASPPDAGGTPTTPDAGAVGDAKPDAAAMAPPKKAVSPKADAAPQEDPGETPPELGPDGCSFAGRGSGSVLAMLLTLVAALALRARRR